MDPDAVFNGDLVHLIMWAFVTIATVAIPAVVVSKTGRAPKGTENNRVTIPSPDGVPDTVVATDGMNPQLAAALSATSVSLTHMMAENRSHEDRIASLEQLQVHLVAEIDTLRKGISNGTIPPLPPLPEALRHFFNDHTA